MRVVFTAGAERHAQTVAAWWQRERQAAATLFVDELGETCLMLASVPYLGQPFESGRLQGVRRVLLPRARYYVYYTVDEERQLVIVRAIWHAMRGHGPSLR
jgi:plasmid stabilization system protein ParE